MKLGKRQKFIFLYINRHQPTSINNISYYLKIPKSIVTTVIISLFDKKCIVPSGFHSWRVKK